MHINNILNLGIYKKSYVGSGSFELVGAALTKFVVNYEGAGNFELAGSAVVGLKYYYTGFGSFELVGKNNGKIPEKLYTNIKFNINQTGTTYDNKQYTVFQVQGVGGYPIYAATNTLQTNLFDNSNLFTDSELISILSNKYSNDITKYQQMINYINQKLNTVPLPEDKEILTNIKFNINETFIDLVNKNNQVVFVYGTDVDPYYTSNSETVNNETSLTPSENVEYKITVNNNLIDQYDNKLNIINEKLSVLTPPIPNYTKINAKFVINNDGFNSLNQAVSVKGVMGTTAQKYYDSNQGVYGEDQLLDESQTVDYFSQKYNEKLNSYAQKLAEINGRLNA
jgi:hypothetical protein